MQRIVLLVLFALFIVAPVSAVEPTPTYSADVLATQAALEAAIDALPVTDQLFTPVPTPEPAPVSEASPTFWDELTPTDIQIYAQYGIIALLLLIVFKQNGKIAELIPQEFALAAVGSFAERARETESKSDDRWASILQMVVAWFYKPPTPPDVPAAPPTPDTPPSAPPAGTSATVTAQEGSTLVITPPTLSIDATTTR